MDYILVIAFLFALAAQDIKDKEVSVPLLACFVVVSAITRIGIDGCITPVILLGAVPGIALIIVGALSKRIGTGDGVSIVGIGLAVGFMKSVVIVAASLAMAAVVGALIMIVKKKKRNYSIPLIPFLFVGTTTWVLI